MIGRSTVDLQDLGVYPLLLVLPFMYLPKLIDGDTQPWIISAALIAFLTFRSNQFVCRRDLALVALSFLCVLAFGARSSSSFLLIRTSYAHISFCMLWLICRREHGDLFPAAIRYSIVLWFIFGAYEFVSVAMGHGLGVPEAFAGRFGEGRSGVPGLTAEPSFYGSLSALQMMYLLTERDAKNRPFIALAGTSVLLSGSLLAALLLIFPFLKLNWRWKLLSIVGVPILAVSSYLVTAGGILSRVSLLQLSEASDKMSGSLFDKLLLDPSLNIRVGNIYYTLYYHFWDSVTLSTPVRYMLDYSKFAKDQGIWWDPVSDYTIPSAGELIYGSGAFGLLLIAAIIIVAQAQHSTWSDKLEKALFLLACFVNPITIANPFLSMYALKQTAAPPIDHKHSRPVAPANAGELAGSQGASAPVTADSTELGTPGRN